MQGLELLYICATLRLQGSQPCAGACFVSYVRQLLERERWGAWLAQLVKHLPLVQVMIPEPWGRVPYWTPC